MARVITADISELQEFAADLTKAKLVLIGRLAERGRTHLVSEIKSSTKGTGNLAQGVAAPDIDNQALRAVLTVSASSAMQGPGVAEVFGADGKLKKRVPLRPTQKYNYAEVVARGNRKATMTPTHARAFLIPVTVAPTGEGYLLIGGKPYILRMTKKGMKPNPYDDRAAIKLEREAEGIAVKVLEQFV